MSWTAVCSLCYSISKAVPLQAITTAVSYTHLDSDEDVFCVYSQYIDDLMMLAKMIRAACDNEKTMGMYLNMSEVAKA